MFLTKKLQICRLVLFGLHSVSKMRKRAHEYLHFQVLLKNGKFWQHSAGNSWRVGALSGPPTPFSRVPTTACGSGPRVFTQDFRGQMHLRIGVCQMLEVGQGTHSVT